MHGKSSRRHRPPAPARRLPHSQTTGLLVLQGQSRNCSVISETVVTVSLTAPTTIVCSEQIAHSRTAGMNLEAEAVTSTCFQLTTLALSWTQHKSRDQF